MGGRGASRFSSAMSIGRHMGLSGFYAPTDIDEAEQWHLNNVYDEAKWRSILPVQRDAIYKYTASYYIPMNDQLFGNTSPRPDISRLIVDATDGMKGMRTTKDFVVWRGDDPKDTIRLLGGTAADMSDPKFLASKIGQTVVFKGFMSSAITEDMAWTWKGVTVKIKVPRGTVGMYVDPISANSGEKEFLFGPGTKMKVHHISRGPTGVLDGVELEVIVK